MPERANVIYRYDGSYEGLLCAVFESFAAKEIPLDIVPASFAQDTLFPVKEIVPDPARAARVAASFPARLGDEAAEFLRHAFLTCLPQKELRTLLFLRAAYRYGPAWQDHLTDGRIAALDTAVRALLNEAHLYKGFVRFSSFGRALVAEIEPKNLVLPLLAQHFTGRFQEETFLILDKTHGMALTYQPHNVSIAPVEALALPPADEAERAMCRLWKRYYDTIEIKGRHNPRCRMGHMPKRYWKYLTEFEKTPTGLTDPFAGG